MILSQALEAYRKKHKLTFEQLATKITKYRDDGVEINAMDLHRLLIKGKLISLDKFNKIDAWLKQPLTEKETISTDHQVR